MDVLNIKDITKSFKDNIVFNDVSISIGENKCYCLVGKNGAGKSTIINILLNVISQDSGSFTIFGRNYTEGGHFIKKNMGVMPEFNPIIDEFTGKEYLNYVSSLYNLDKQSAIERIDYLINYFFEYFDEEKLISQYSKGMRLKIGLSAALINNPKLLILDEPFDGLDVVASNKLVTYLNEYRNKGNAIFLASHNMLYVEKVATDIGVLNNQKLVHSSPLNNLLNCANSSLEEIISKLLGYETEVQASEKLIR